MREVVAEGEGAGETHITQEGRDLNTKKKKEIQHKNSNSPLQQPPGEKSIVVLDLSFGVSFRNKVCLVQSLSQPMWKANNPPGMPN